MKINRISFKVFFSFFFIMTLTFLVFFAIMRSFRISEFEKIHKYYREISILAFTEVFKNSFHPYSADEIKNNRHYLELLNGITEKYQLKIVIADKNNHILLHNFSDNLPADFYQKLKVEKNAADNLKNPFPVELSHKTAAGEDLNIFLLSSYDSTDNNLIINILLTLLFSINLILLFGVSRWITRPVGKFSSAIKSISDGDYSTKIEIKSYDEFDDLARTFNSMTFRIQQTMLEQKETSANISHELRSPLTRIKVVLQILRDLTGECADKDFDHYFDAIDKDVDGMDNLIDGILKLYRIDSDCAQMKHRIDILALLNQQLEQETELFNHLNITVQTDFKSGSFVTRVTPAIKTVFSNLISNAAKYTQPGGLFSLSADHENGVLKIIFVNSLPKDHGIDLSKLVSPFYRGKNAVNIKGNGMGLTIARRIIEMSGSRIDFYIRDNCFMAELELKQ